MEANQLERQIKEVFPIAHPPDREHSGYMVRWLDENGSHEYLHPEALGVQAFFQGKPWHDFVGEPLVNSGGAAFSMLSFLNVQARIYYLPAYMLTVMRSINDNPDLVEGLFNRLIPPEDPQSAEERRKEVLALIDKCDSTYLSAEQKNSLREIFERTAFRSSLQQAEATFHSIKQNYDDFISALSLPQKQAIREFIVFMQKTYGESIEDLTDKAMKGYWGKMMI